MCGVDCVILKKWRHHEIKHHEDLKRKKIDKSDILNIQFKEDPFFLTNFHQFNGNMEIRIILEVILLIGKNIF